ncbi:A24 family peptidase [Variovorax terrae]|uniref:A24 family peptidase n=1 Tax=Variovorax terrae TaxID=2923278 RepID=A0A9X1VVA0_9BURK|nr:A24 family peptidase [Variovorax terrae]MCJ0763915.1 A24 family peptidase [Variovorax terrae]
MGFGSSHLLLAWLLMAIVWDCRMRRVPNGLVLSGAACAMLALAVGGSPFHITFLQALLGGAVGFAVLLPFYATGVMGAGDVKFACVAGLWFGWQPLLPIWVLGSLLAGMHALVWLAVHRWKWGGAMSIAFPGARSRADAADEPHAEGHPPGGFLTRSRQRQIPYAAYLAIAALAIMAVGP